MLYLYQKQGRHNTKVERKDMNYKGFDIDDSMYGLITVQHCGDDLVFDSMEEAKQFIDEVTEG